MNKKFIISLLIIVGFLVLTSLLILKISEQKKDIALFTDSLKHYSIVLKNKEVQVYEQSVLLLTKDEAIKVGKLENEQLRKLQVRQVSNITKLEGQVIILQDSLKLSPKIIIKTIKDSSGNSADYMKLPAEILDINNDSLKLKAGVDTNKLSYFSLQVPFNASLILGIKNNKPTTILTTTNSYLKINKLDVTILKSKWYDKWYIYTGLGIISSALIFKVIK